MFPDIRLLILALFTSIVALTCGFGVFAAFRVNHEPLSRLPADTTPLQLVADGPAAPAVRWAVPFRPRSSLGAARIGRATTETPEPAPPPREPLQPRIPRTVGTAKPEPTAGAPQRQASQPTQLSDAAATPPAPPALPAPIPAMPAPTAPMATAVSAPAQQAPPVQTQAVRTAPAMVGDAAGKTAAEPAKAVIPGVAAIEPAAPTVAPPVEITGTPPETVAPEAKVPAKLVRKVRPRTLRRTARKTIERRRVVLKKRATGTPPAAAFAQFDGGSSTFREPVFQSAPNFQPNNETRARSTRKTANRSAPSSPSVWPNDE